MIAYARHAYCIFPLLFNPNYDIIINYSFFHICTGQNKIIKKKGKGTLLYSAVSSLWDRSKRFTLHPLADLFIPRPSQLLWEAFNHAIARKLFVHISTTVCIARYSFIQLTVATWGDQTCQRFEVTAVGFETGLS